MRFEFEPYKGPLPLEFGMTQLEVRQLLGLSPKRSVPPDEYGGARDEYDDIAVNFDEQGRAAEFCFAPSNNIELVFSGTTLIGPGAVSNPISILKKMDNAPKEDVGFLVFYAIGLNTTGYHDNDESQRAINVFKRGFWDEPLV